MNIVLSSATMNHFPSQTPGAESSPPDRVDSRRTQPPDTSIAAGNKATMSTGNYYSADQNEASYQQGTFQTSRSIRSEEGLDLQGPLQVNGSVKSGGSINLEGDFMVRDRIDAYGAINMNGNVTCDGRIKAYGNIDINGYLVARDRIKGFGRLRVVGSLEGTELEIYGNLTIDGHLKCRCLVVYGSLTLIGPESSYSVEDSEEIAGAKLRRDQEADWDW